MIEIVFSESAGGGLKVAQSCGKGKYIGSCVGVILSHKDGSRPAEEEIAEARRRAEERERAAWEKAVPLGGSAKDVFAIGLGLSVGDISEEFPGERRREIIRELFSIYPKEASGAADEIFESSLSNINEAMRRIKAGEKARLWYSGNPDELCGMFWFMEQLQLAGACDAEIEVVRLPEWELNEEDNIIIRKNSWGEVEPEEWHKYIELGRKVSRLFIRVCASCWKELRQENAPLRAVVNGKLMSVDESFYDVFIMKELDGAGDEFREAVVIGNVLGRYQLGIGDAWVARRIQRMVDKGQLKVIREAGEGMPSYHRVLQKCP